MDLFILYDIYDHIHCDVLHATEVASCGADELVSSVTDSEETAMVHDLVRN